MNHLLRLIFMSQCSIYRHRQVPKKVKPRQSAPATIDQSSSTTRPSSQFPRSETSRAVQKEFRQDDDDDEPVFSDYNPFQSPSGNESGGRGVAAKAATKPKKDRRKVSRMCLSTTLLSSDKVD